jgi:hypothetical protein
MKSIVSFRSVLIFTLLSFIGPGLIFGQNKSEDGFLGKAELYKAKKTALDYLSDGLTVEKYGHYRGSSATFK